MTFMLLTRGYYVVQTPPQPRHTGSEDQGVGMRLALFSIITLNNSITHFYSLGFADVKVLRHQRQRFRWGRQPWFYVI